MPGRARDVLRIAPLWIWLAISLTVLGVGAGGLGNRAREAARLRATGTSVTATVAVETPAGKAIPFGHQRTKISIWYEYQSTTHKTVLACGSFDDCPHRGDTMTLWLDPANPANFVTEYGDLADDDAANWYITVVGGLATAIPLAVLSLWWRDVGRTPGPRRRIARRAAGRAIQRAAAEPPAGPRSRFRRTKSHGRRGRRHR